MALADSPVNIIGAGLAGSLLAVYLARRGIEVHLFERRADMRNTPIPAGRSINLALANRGLAALQQVGLDDDVQPLLTPMRGRMMHDLQGELLLQPYGQRPDEVIYSVSRAHLNILLLNAADAHEHVRVHFEHRVEQVDFDTGAIRVLDKRSGEHRDFTRGPTICAGGATSRIRRQMMAREGFEASVDYLEHDYKELTLPASPQGAHQIASDALHIWPRGSHMLIALPNLDGSFTVTLFMPRQGKPGFDRLNTSAKVRDFFACEFADIVPLIPALEQEFSNNPAGQMQTVLAFPWHVGGNALLFGDAAHGIVPFHGQGMNAAFEDCRELDACLTHPTDTWESVFSRFQSARKPNTDAIAQMALENYIEMRDSVRDPGFHLRKQVAWELERRHPTRFVPRYTMVSFRHIPYAQALHRGEIQTRILRQLTHDAVRIEEVDFEYGAQLVLQQLPPLDAGQTEPGDE